MTLYTVALFIHIVGAIGAFIGVSVWLFAALALRRARSVGQVRALTGLIQPSGVLAVVSILLLGVAGLYMAVTVWGEQATWIVVATVAFLLLAPFGALVIDPRLRAIAKAAATAPEGPLSAALAKCANSPLVGIWLSIYLAVLLGIVFVMTNKPPLVDSIIAIVGATALGLASGPLLWWAARARPRNVGNVGEVATPTELMTEVSPRERT
jgi:hypothetical protein